MLRDISDSNMHGIMHIIHQKHTSEYKNANQVKELDMLNMPRNIPA